MSTSISAGLAAIILDFCRQSSSQKVLQSLLLARLTTVGGMEAILMRMAEGSMDQGYKYVVPWNVLKCVGPEFDDFDDDERRFFICDTIRRALMNK